MASANILRLPNELLDNIFFFLDHDSTVQTLPLQREDLFSISRTCKHLRSSVIPRLFATVRICIRWVDGLLLETGLHRIIHHRPDLAQHVRCIHFSLSNKDFNPDQDQQRRWVLGPAYYMYSSDKTKDWTLGLPITSGSHALQSQHRQSIDTVARKYCTELFPALAVDIESTSAESLIVKMSSEISQRQTNIGQPSHSWFHDPLPVDSSETPNIKRQGTNANIDSLRLARYQVDALATAIICIPPGLKRMVFEAPDVFRDNTYLKELTQSFRRSVTEIFHARIEDLGLVSYHTFERLRSPPGAEREVDGIACLSGVQKLTLSASSDCHALPGPANRLSLHRSVSWGNFTTTITQLDLWNISSFCRAVTDSLDDLLALIREFSVLERVSLSNMSCLRGGFGRRHGLTLLAQTLANPNPVNAGNGDTFSAITSLPSAWLIFTIALRREQPKLKIRLHNLSVDAGVDAFLLPRPTMSWLMSEVVPIHKPTDFDREQRLLEDFESFLPLWTAEISERGQQAINEHKTNGWLVDAAMSNRWNPPNAWNNTPPDETDNEDEWDFDD